MEETMTRKDFYGYAKKYGIAILIALPILICLNLLMLNKLSMFWMVVVDCLVLVAVFFKTLYIAQKIRDRISNKRAIFVSNKEKEAQEQQSQAFAEKQEEKQEMTVSKKVVQKQNKNYPAIKHKKK